MDDLITLLLIAIISLGIGIAFGSLVANAILANRKEGESKRNEASGLVETARIYRDARHGTTVLEVKGKQYRSPKDLDAGGRTFLEQQLNPLLAWVKPGEVSRIAAPDSPERSGGALPGKEPALARPSVEEGPKQAFSPLDVFARALSSDVRKPAAPNASIAAQIDEILQEKLSGLPDEKRAIRLMELPGKGMVVMVGLDHYDGVDAVPDPEVRTLIRECVAEWEQRMGRQD
jgi:hypothetical protein